MTALDYTVLVVYFLVMAGIGFWCMRRVKVQEDYFMGGRSFGKLLQTFAAFGAGTGAHEPAAVGRTVWTSGLSGIWSALLWLFITPFYWITGVWYRRMRHTTLGDWFVERYESKPMGAAYTVFALTFYVMYLSTMFTAITKIATPLLGVGVDSVSLWAGADPVGIQYVLVPMISVMVIVYGVMGGLMAAYWTDLIQGVFIILLSILLIPSGLMALVEKFGDPATQGVMDGFAIMHERLNPEYFQLFDGPSAGEFPLHYIVSLTLLALVGIVVQPHFITTGGGSAKNELTARVGLVVGNFLKRLCTVGWGLTGLIVLVLLADSVELSKDPDMVWGVAAREVLGPLGFGLVGLMLACLLAALMSSADTYMIVASALVVRNVYVPFVNPTASDQTCVRLARLTGLVIIAGAAVAALTMNDVFAQFKLALELPIVFAAPFWVGMWWRRAGKWAAWGTMGVSMLLFFVLPMTLGVLRDNPDYFAANPIMETTTTRAATEVDVARRTAAIEVWEAKREKAGAEDVAALGEKPSVLVLGDSAADTIKTGGKAVFWSGGLKAVGADGEMLKEGPATVVVETTELKADVVQVVKAYAGPMRGAGDFRVDFLIYHWAGFDLSSQTSAMLETLRLPPRLLTPFLVMILLGLVLPCNRKESLNRYFAKMKTPVETDPEADRLALEAAYANPLKLESRKMFPGTSIEIQRPTVADVVGFVLCFGVCFSVVSLLVWLAGIGG